MGNDGIESFREYRKQMNEKLLAQDNQVIRRIFHLDSHAYLDGALKARTKEMLGLVSSMVLRCDDCVKYHPEKCFDYQVSTEEIIKFFAVANLVGGTIVIPHSRRALEYWEAPTQTGRQE